MNELISSDDLARRTKLSVDESRHVINRFLYICDAALREDSSIVLRHGVWGPAATAGMIADRDCTIGVHEQASYSITGAELAELIDTDQADGPIFTTVDIVSIMQVELERIGVIIDRDVLVDAVDVLGDLLIAAGGTFDLAPLALESAVEDWVTAHIGDVGASLGMPGLHLHASDDGRSGRQWRFTGGSRPDLVCRAGEGGRFDPALWVIVELKRGLARPEDLDQLTGYLDLARRELDVVGEGVAGILIADGFDRVVASSANDRDSVVMLASLVQIGFHRSLHR